MAPDSITLVPSPCAYKQIAKSVASASDSTYDSPSSIDP